MTLFRSSRWCFRCTVYAQYERVPNFCGPALAAVYLTAIFEIFFASSYNASNIVKHYEIFYRKAVFWCTLVHSSINATVGSKCLLLVFWCTLVHSSINATVSSKCLLVFWCTLVHSSINATVSSKCLVLIQVHNWIWKCFPFRYVK